MISQINSTSELYFLSTMCVWGAGEQKQGSYLIYTVLCVQSTLEDDVNQVRQNILAYSVVTL